MSTRLDTDQFEIRFVSHNRAAKCQPNPDFPNGVEIDDSYGAPRTCIALLPYPAPCCGVMIARCRKCGLSVGATTAGRVDDPRAIKMACKKEGQ